MSKHDLLVGNPIEVDPVVLVPKEEIGYNIETDITPRVTTSTSQLPISQQQWLQYAMQLQDLGLSGQAQRIVDQALIRNGMMDQESLNRAQWQQQMQNQQQLQRQYQAAQNAWRDVTGEDVS